MAEEPAKQEDPVICEGDILCDRYRADRVLEHGGTGTVLAVTDLVRDERAAIKMISADHGDGPLLLARLRREADILSRLTSPHVVRVLDVAMHGRTLCLVMELLKGSNMARFVRRRGALPIEEAVGYIVQACDGLADAHAAGVVHRDVKPQNVFLADRSDGTAIVKVLDFGVSKQHSVSGGSGLTVGGELLGSPPYSAPEQLRDPSGVDGRADVWSIGLVLYFLLTRRNAYDADTFPALLIKIATQPPPPLRQQRPDVPEELEAIFLRCVEKEREDRFPDMASLARALTPFAPSWSKSFVPAILARVEGRGSLASLPVIPLRPDPAEEAAFLARKAAAAETPAPTGVAEMAETAETADEGDAESGAADDDAEPGAADEEGAEPAAAGETVAKRESHADTPAKPEAATDTPAKPEAAGDTPAEPGTAADTPAKPAKTLAKPGAPAAPAPTRGWVKALVVVLVAVLAPALVGAALFLVTQFTGCRGP